MYNRPVIPEEWEVNSNWAFLFSFIFIVPIWGLLLYVLLLKVRTIEVKKRWADVIMAFMISSVILFVLFVVFNLAYGMRP